MQKWEYLQIEVREESKIMESSNHYGDEGWELVAVTYDSGQSGTGKWLDAGGGMRMPETEFWQSWQLFFKRPK
jgi:hypothetical protein